MYKQLLKYCWWAAEQMQIEARNRGKDIVFQEVYRTQERQNELFCKGRSPNEVLRLFKYAYITAKQRDSLLEILREKPWLENNDVVTWTLNSKHTQRLAADIKPINMSFDELKEIAEMFGVTQPIPNDRWHHEFDNCKVKPLLLSVEWRIKALQNAIKNRKKEASEMAKRKLGRLLARLRTT